MNITDFLLERIGEDRRAAAAAADAGQPASWGPARVLEAHQKIVLDFIEYEADAVACAEPTGLLGMAAVQAIEHLAATYADHPDYDRTWSPA